MDSVEFLDVLDTVLTRLEALGELVVKTVDYDGSIRLTRIDKRHYLELYDTYAEKARRVFERLQSRSVPGRHSSRIKSLRDVSGRAPDPECVNVVLSKWKE